MKKLLFFIICITCIKLHAQTPTITSFSPTTGTIGSLITITGTNLSSATTISIGGIAAIKISSNNNTLVAMVMPGTSTGTVQVSSPSGTASSIYSYTKTSNGSPNIQEGAKLVGIGGIGNSGQGSSVSLSADGNTAIVGGTIDNNYTGAAWIYVRSGKTWIQQGGKLVGTGASSNSLQGNAVALSADGNTAIVGGYYDNNGIGAAWVFTRNGNNWTQQGTKLLGTGAIGQCWQGCSVALSADGNTAIIGGSYDSIAVGAAWVFKRSGNNWTQQGNKLVGSGRIGWSNQGTSVSLSADGNTAIVGGYYDNNAIGAAWVFTRSGNNWIQQGSKLVGTSTIGNYAYQGASVKLSADGNTAIIGGYGDNSYVGAAWVFTRSGNNWTQQGGKLVGNGAVGRSCQGNSISISADGNTAVVGGFGDNTNTGATWIFCRTNNTWSQIGNKLIGIGLSNQSQQGVSVAISADGNTAIVGGNYDSTNNIGAGAAWVFVSPSKNANLANLIINNGTLNPSFNKDSLNYITNVNNAINSIILTPSKEDSNATIQVRINGGAYSNVNSSTASSALNLNVGINAIEVMVTAQDGTTIKIYTIRVSRATAPTQLSITAFLEGFYLGNNIMIASPYSANHNNPTNIADTIIVELHQAMGTHDKIYSSSSTLSTNGIASISFPSASSGNSYYIVVKHRNSIETWSASPVLFNTSTSYNFSTAASQAYGSNLSNVGNGMFAIYSGDINQDGSVDFNDYPALDISSNNGDLGYYATDLNGDASVDFNDYPILDINSNLGILTLTP